MEITLKKARKLDKALRESLSKVELAGTARLSIYGDHGIDDVETLVKNRTSTYDASLETYLEGMRAATTLRTAIGTVNDRVGINVLLAEHGVLIAMATKLGAVPAAAAVNAKEVSRKLDANAKAESAYGAENETVTVAASGVAAKLAETRKRKLAVEDELARLNQVTTIGVGDDLRRVLERYDLV